MPKPEDRNGADDRTCVSANLASSTGAMPAATSEASAPKADPDTPLAKLFARLLEHIRQGVKLTDDIHNATGKKHSRAHEYTLTGLDTAGQEAKKWRRLCQ